MTAVMLSVENGSSVSSWVGSLSVSWCICLNDQATKLEIHFYKRCVSELRSFSLYSFFRTNDSPLTSRTIMIRTSPTVCEGAGGIEKEFFIRKYVLLFYCLTEDWNKMSTAPCIPRRSPIQVLTCCLTLVIRRELLFST